MSEELILTDPIEPPAPPPATTKYRVSSFTMDMDIVMPSDTPGEPGMVTIKLVDNNAKLLMHQYTGKQASNMIKSLNTANLTTKSMHKRILEKLSADGVIPGTVTGTPDPVVP